MKIKIMIIVCYCLNVKLSQGWNPANFDDCGCAPKIMVPKWVWSYKLCLPNASLPTSRIVGGTDANHYDYPWFVTVDTSKFLYNGKKVSYCGGSILNRHWVISAAHCLENFSGRKIEESETNLIVINTLSGSFNVKKVVFHPFRTTSPKFKGPLNWNWDMALLKTEQPMNKTNLVKICLFEEKFNSRKAENEFWQRMEMMFIGKGNTKARPQRDYSYPEVLQQKRYKLHDLLPDCPGVNCRGKCDCTYWSGGPWTMDSGGPLMLREREGGTLPCWRLHSTLVGHPSGQISTVFFKVYHYRQWIDEVIGESDSS